MIEDVGHKTCSVGIVGAGVIATSVHVPVLKAMEGASIAWIADVREEIANAVARRNRIIHASLKKGPEGLPPADVVLLALPVPPRAAYLDHYSATQTGILVEKPPSNSFAEHLVLQATFEPWRIATGYQRRHYGTSKCLASILRSGTFGPLRSVQVWEGGRTTRTDGGGGYMSAPVDLGGGIVKNLGCHSLDLILWLTGAASFEIEDCAVSWDDGTDQACQARIKLAGMAVSETCRLDWKISWIDRMANCMEFTFADVRLRCPISPSSWLEMLSPAGDIIGQVSAAGPDRAITSAQAFYLQWRDVISGLQRRSEQATSLRSTALSAQLIDALLQR